MSSDQPMSVVVEYQIRAGNNTMEQWLAEWENRAEDVQKGEPETTAYAAAVCLENNLQVLIFERYARGNGSLAVHMERPAHYTLSAIMGERRMTKRRVMGFCGVNS